LVGDAATENSGFLSTNHDLADQVEIFFQLRARKLSQEFRTMAKLRLEDGRHRAVRPQGGKMKMRQVAQLRCRILYLLQFGTRPCKELSEGGRYRRLKDLFLVLKIKINGAIGHAGALGYLRNPRLEIAVFRDHQHGGIEDALVFV